MKISKKNIVTFMLSAVIAGLLVSACKKDDDNDGNKESAGINSLTLPLDADCDGSPCF